MKRKKGFTLIELLAVIVILAIIALIATPIILNVINDARKSAAKDSAYGYIEAIETQNQLAQLDSQKYSKIESGDVTSLNNKVNVKGTKPTSGTVTIENRKVTSANLCIEGYTVVYNGKEVTSTTKGCSSSSSSNEQEEPTTPSEPEPTTPAPVSFETDSWATIAANTTSDKYNVGDTKCVALTGLTTTNNNGCSNGEFKVRIANKTACTTETSKTACGFVVEFVDVIATHNMNPSGEYKGTQYNYGWNVDGYPASAMYTYLNTTIYNKLKAEIGDIIIDTTVVSGHGSTTGETNFTSTDKLYLLSTKEVGFDVDCDTAKIETRKLDYYDAGTGDAAKAKRVKQYNESNKFWWFRSASSFSTNYFYNVNASGSNDYGNANDTRGVAPAFRIGS